MDVALEFRPLCVFPLTYPYDNEANLQCIVSSYNENPKRIRRTRFLTTVSLVFHVPRRIKVLYPLWSPGIE